MSFFTELGLMGSLFWFGIEGVNVYLSIKNPFVDPKKRNKTYHTFVWLFALIAAIVLAAAGNTDYRDHLHICFTRETESFNISNWLSLYLWIILNGLISFFSIFYGRQILRCDNLEEKIRSERLRVIKRGITTSIGFFAFWSIAIALWLAVFIAQNVNDQMDTEYVTRCYAAIGVLLLSIGILDGIFWMFLNNESVTKFGFVSYFGLGDHGLVRDLRGPIRDISVDLRKEFIANVVEGVRNVVIRGDSTTEDEDGCVVLRLESGARLKAYDPIGFLKLRSDGFHCSASALLESFPPSTDSLEKKFSEGASGSMFFFTKDMKFIVKTVTPSESHFLRHIFKEYQHYMIRQNRKSLISRFYGSFSLMMYSTKHYFVVLENIFWSPQKLQIHTRYDLKGSWIKRWAKYPDPSQNILKDNDLHRDFCLDNERARDIFKQSVQDVIFLYSLGIMDYSMLIGIHECLDKVSEQHCSAIDTIEEESKEENSLLFYRDFYCGTRSNVVRGDGVYYFGLIDILQAWNWSKRLERLVKSFYNFAERNGISAIEPRKYVTRFILMLSERLGVGLEVLSDIPGISVELVAERVLKDHGDTIEETLVRVRLGSFVIDNWQHIDPELGRVSRVHRDSE